MAEEIIPSGCAADGVLHTDSAPVDGWIGTGRSDGVIHPGFADDGWIGTGLAQDGVMHPWLTGPDPLPPLPDFG
ncbi:MAG TPA: hypothetical protein VF535_01635 [Allosphingosinicella sp.]|jgi:hypothetical protein